MVHYSASAFWDNSSLAATAVESSGKNMASGGRWWSPSADYRKIETSTRCLFRWLEVRFIFRHPKWSLCLFCFPGVAKHIPWSWKFTAQTSKGGQSVPWRLRPPPPQRHCCLWCLLSWGGFLLYLIWFKAAEESSYAEVCEEQSGPLMYWDFLVSTVPANCWCGMALQKFWSENTLN